MEEQFSSNNGFLQTLKRNRWPLLLTFFTTFAIILFLYFFYGYATDIGPEQPIPFSHQVHVGVKKIQCEFCHPYVKYSNHPGLPPVEKCLYCHSFHDDGTFEGIPRLEKCMECHDDPESSLGESLEEEHFLKKFVANENEVPWFSYSRQPDCVYFSHIAHVKMGEMDCRTCHGDHGKNHQLPVYGKNRLTGYSIDIWGRHISGYKKNTWDRMKMDDCSECHTQKGHEENNACFVCHK